MAKVTTVRFQQTLGAVAEGQVARPHRLQWASGATKNHPGMTNSSSFRLTARGTPSISLFMQTLPLDRKSPRQSTRCASSPEVPARPLDGAQGARRDREKAGNLAAILAELWAPPRARFGALARRLETLGQGLFRVGVEPLSRGVSLWSRLVRLLQLSRELMEMGHQPKRTAQGQDALRSGGPRKTHRLAALRRLSRRRERGRVGCTRRSASALRAPRRLSPRPVRIAGVSISR